MAYYYGNKHMLMHLRGLFQRISGQRLGGPFELADLRRVLSNDL